MIAGVSASEPNSAPSDPAAPELVDSARSLPFGELTALPGDDEQAALVAAVNATIRTWSEPGFVPHRLVPDRLEPGYERLSAQADRQPVPTRWPGDEHRGPVLVGMVNVRQNSLKLFARAKYLPALVEVYANGYVRVTCDVDLSWPVLEVADIGGAPSAPELYLTQEYWAYADYKSLSAEPGTPAAETVRALHVLAAASLWKAPPLSPVFYKIKVDPYLPPLRREHRKLGLESDAGDVQRSESGAHRAELGDSTAPASGIGGISVEVSPGPGSSRLTLPFGELPAVPGDEAQEALVEEVNGTLRRWKAPGFTADRIIPQYKESTFEQLLRLADKQSQKPVRWSGDAERDPVLIALFSWKISNAGFMGTAKTIDILCEAYANGYARLTSRHPLDNHVLPIADLGGAPRPPQLVLSTKRHPLVAYNPIVAKPGTPAAQTMRALHVLASASIWEAPTFWIDDDRIPRVDPYVRPARPRNPEPPKPVREGRGTKPQSRLVRDFRESEELVVEWVRWLGWEDAHVTPAGADSGLDVVGEHVAGQVKFEAVKTGRPTLQGLFGAGTAAGASRFVFFSSAGYTAQAVAWGDQVGMYLFRFSIDGSIEPVNDAAAQLFQEL